MFAFVASELVLGGLLGEYVVGRYTSLSLSFVIQGLLHLTSFFVGGFVIGVVSPGVRVLEPAAGAALTIVLMMSLTWLTPYTFIGMQPVKLALGGALAFVVALAGAKLGERVTGNRVS